MCHWQEERQSNPLTKYQQVENHEADCFVPANDEAKASLRGGTTKQSNTKNINRLKIIKRIAFPLLLRDKPVPRNNEAAPVIARRNDEAAPVIASNDFFGAKKEKKLNDIHTLLLVFQRVKEDVIIRRNDKAI